MSFLKNIFKRKDKPITSYADFWEWFSKNESVFSKVVKNHTHIERDFFDQLSPRLNELKEGFFYVTGMYDSNTVELIITADGVIKNIAFAEELVKAAPEIKGWKFTALKPPLDITDVNIEMDGLSFNSENLSFFANEHAAYPDEIDLTIVHSGYDEQNSQAIINGVYLFLDNYLGELDFALSIDNLQVTGNEAVTAELIPIEKLRNYLTWRQKEFIEKYVATRHNTDNDTYSSFTATLENGKPVIGVVNSTLMSWDSKASHPWVVCVEIGYSGAGNNGLPDKKMLNQLNDMEDAMTEALKESDGYLNVGRETGNNIKRIYFACKEFRKPSKRVYEMQNQYAGQFSISCEIYKDKYWQSLNRFIVTG